VKNSKPLSTAHELDSIKRLGEWWKDICAAFDMLSLMAGLFISKRTKVNTLLFLVFIYIM
jgi:hypothetical protein